MEWSGVEWSGAEWSGVEWSGVEWSGVESSRAAGCPQRPPDRSFFLRTVTERTSSSVPRAIQKPLNARRKPLFIPGALASTAWVFLNVQAHLRQAWATVVVLGARLPGLENHPRAEANRENLDSLLFSIINYNFNIDE